MQKQVLTDLSPSYSAEEKEVSPGAEYEYKLRVSTGLSNATEVVLVDSLENASGGRWKGTLTGIDASFAKLQGFDVQTYWSADVGAQSLSDSWSLLDGSTDLSQVQSLMFKWMDSDGNPAVITPGTYTYVLVKMQAPDELLPYAAQNCYKSEWKVMDDYGFIVQDVVGLTSNTTSITIKGGEVPKNLDVTVLKTGVGEMVGDLSVKFKLYQLTDQEEIFLQDLSVDGEATVSLPVGIYVLEEYDTPEGFVPAQPVFFRVAEGLDGDEGLTLFLLTDDETLASQKGNAIEIFNYQIGYGPVSAGVMKTALNEPKSGADYSFTAKFWPGQFTIGTPMSLEPYGLSDGSPDEDEDLPYEGPVYYQITDADGDVAESGSKETGPDGFQFKLKDGYSISFYGFPADTKVWVAEEEPGMPEGWSCKTSWTDGHTTEEGRTAEGFVQTDEPLFLDYTNQFYGMELPATGGTGWRWYGLGIILLESGLVILASRKRWKGKRLL